MDPNHVTPGFGHLRNLLTPASNPDAVPRHENFWVFFDIVKKRFAHENTNDRLTMGDIYEFLRE